MKKMISVLSAFTIALTAIPTCAHAKQSDDPELYELAYSLGADKDYLSIINYVHDEERPLNKSCYEDFLSKCSIIEAAYASDSKFKALTSNGLCMGIAMIEILSHNGIISPSDLKDGAASLKEITYDEEIDKYITNYQAVQAYSKLDMYDQYLIDNLTYEEKIDRLIATAEKCMKEKRYFFIDFRDKTFAHALCGIGVTDGSWTFNDKSYDKCVLVLDSNAKNKDMEPIGFTNEICIYISSETKESYIPYYDSLFADDNKMSFVAIDDDTLLNNKGAINPSEKIDTDLTGMKQFWYNEPAGQNIKVYSMLNNPDSSSDQDKMIAEDMGDKNCFKADVIKMEIEKGKLGPRGYIYVDEDRWIDISFTIDTEDAFETKAKLNCDIEISDDKVSITNKNDVPLVFNAFIHMNDNSYNFAPYYKWSIGGKVTDKVEIEISDNGMLFKNEGMNDANISPSYYTLDDNGIFEDFIVNLPNKYDRYYLSTSNNVLLSIDEDKNVVYYIDDNGDDVYDTRVQKGDINCDGFIDAVDASKVLSVYARLSTIINNPVDYSLGDINNDGFIDAVDASAILAKYAELSTT